MNTKIKTPVRYLRIANSRGRRPVITDIKRARKLLQDVGIEINDCKGAEDIKKCVDLLWNILQDNS